ncbi:hypothetical protein KC909_02685, partial [Candidatus Dojkabacteria bacterium]|nr:hypothetical protein [Candidatus Dojkabacteria bacterium]
LFTDIGNNVLVIKNSNSKAEVFKLDVIVAIIIALFFTILALVFIILVATDNWYFEIEKKNTKS